MAYIRLLHHTSGHASLQTGDSTPHVAFWPRDAPREQHVLSIGAWVGIIVGCAAAVFSMLMVAVIYKKRQTKKRQAAAPASLGQELSERPTVTLGACAQCGSRVRFDSEYVRCCDQLFHKRCVHEDTTCLGVSDPCIGRPALPKYERPPEYTGTTP